MSPPRLVPLLCCALLFACGGGDDAPDGGPGDSGVTLPTDGGSSETPDGGSSETPDGGSSETPDGGSSETPDGGSVPGNGAPVWGPLGQKTVPEGSLFTYELSATDPDGDPITFALVGAPAYVSLSGTTLTASPGFELVMPPSQWKDVDVRLSVTDGLPAHTREGLLTLRVTQVNQAPTLEPLAPISLTAGEVLTVPLRGSDPDGQALVFSVPYGTSPAWVAALGESLQLAPPAHVTFDGPVTVRASDGSHFADRTVQVTVLPHPGSPPTLAPLQAMVLAAGATAQQPVSASDPEGAPLTVSLSSNAPGWLTLAPAGDDFLLTAAPPAGTSFNAVISVTAFDGTHSALQSFQLRVTTPNQPPTVSALAQLNTANTVVAAGYSNIHPPSLRATVSDAEGDAARLEAEVRLTSEAFTEVPNFRSVETGPGTRSLPLSSLPAGEYKWRVRARSADGATSAWSDYNAGAAAFTVQAQALTGSVLINGGDASTSGGTLQLSLTASADVTQMRFARQYGNWGPPRPFASTDTYTLPTVLTDGSLRIWVELQNAGGATAVFFDEITLDTRGPQVVNLRINGGAAATRASTVILDYTVTDASGIALHEASNDMIVFSPISGPGALWELGDAEGERPVWVRVTDVGGNVSQLALDFIELDQTPPLVSVQGPGLGLAAGAEFTRNRVLPFAHSASDVGSGLAQACVGYAPDALSCFAYSPAPSVGLEDRDGPQTLYLQLIDGVGNRSAVVFDGIVLDRVAPTLSAISVNGGAPTASSNRLEVAVQASDDHGVVTLKLSQNVGYSFLATPFLGNGVPHTRRLTQEGQYFFGAIAVDHAGNESAPLRVTEGITVDMPPTITRAGGIGLVSTSRTVQLTLRANQSCGEASAVVLPASAPAPTAPGPFTPLEIGQTVDSPPLTLELGEADGDYTIYLWVKDLNGQQSVEPHAVTVKLDRTPPSAPDLQRLVRAGHRTLTLDFLPATDDGSGIAYHEVGVSMQPGGPYTWRLFTSTYSPVTFSEFANNVRQYVVLRARDKGNLIGPVSAELSGVPYFPWEFQHRTPTSEALYSLAWDPGAGRWLVGGKNGALYASEDLIHWERLDPRTDEPVNDIRVDSAGVWLAHGNRVALSTSPTSAFELLPQPPQSGHAQQATAFLGVDPQGASRWVSVGQRGTAFTGVGSGGELPSFTARTTTTTYDPLLAVTAVATPGVVVAAGGRARVIRSTNYGVTWSGVTLPAGYVTAYPDRDWNCSALVQVPGTDTLYLGCDYFGTSALKGLLVSTDGGQSFTTDPNFTRQDVTALAVFGETLFIGSESGGFSQGMIHRYEGGVLTDLTPPEMAAGSTAGIIPQRIVARSSSELLVLASDRNFVNVVQPRLYHTTDGGQTWRDVLPFEKGTFHSIITQDGNTLVAGSSRAIWRSEDGGLSWAVVFQGGESAALSALALTSTGSAGVGFAVGFGELLHSGDGGRTWAPHAQSGTLQPLFGVSCWAEDACVAVGRYKSIYLWDGQSWTLAVPTSGGSSDEYLRVRAYTDDQGVRRAIVTGQPTLLARFDGTSWVQTTSAGQLGDPGVREDGSGFIRTRGFLSRDHGETWTATGTEHFWRLAHVPGTSTWYAVGAQLLGQVLRSEDDGETFSFMDLQTTQQLSSLAVLNDQELWVGGGNGTVLHTVTGGE